MVGRSPSRRVAILNSLEKTSALLVKKFWILWVLRKTEGKAGFLTIGKMVLPLVSPMVNTNNSTTFATADQRDLLIMFGIPTIIILLLSILVIVTTIYKYYNSKRHVLPRFEPVMVRTSLHAEGGGAA